MAKNKRRDQARAKRAARRRKRRQARPARSGASEPAEYEVPPPSAHSLVPPDLARCFPPVHIGEGLRRVPDPYALLGLDPSEAPDPARIRAAWHRALERHPPEREPEIARSLTAARDRLLAPERVIERLFGVLHPPDPAAHGLPVETIPSAPPHQLPSRTRLLGQLALYALLEKEFRNDAPPPPAQRELPF